MNIALDISPLNKASSSQHKVRGSGFYITYLQEALQKYFPDHTYTPFYKGDKLSRSIDLIHYPYFEPFFKTLPFVKKKPSLVTIHDLIPFVFPKHFPAGIQGKLTWLFQRRLLQGMDGIITDSYASKNDIISFSGNVDEKIHVIYLAAGKEFIQVKNKSMLEKTRKEYNLPEKFILSVGDVTWNKNLPRLIEAINKLQIPLVMVGKALTTVYSPRDASNMWLKDVITVQKLTKNNPNIMTLGFVPTPDLVNIYNIATLFIMPSLYEGFGLPILEAMQSGCPVITTKEGSLPEIAQESAYYVDAYSSDHIASGIQEVFVSRKLQETLKHAGLLQASKFSWQKTAEKTINVYKKITDSS